jgi:hypothetical protein
MVSKNFYLFAVQDILATMERPPDLATPMSADYCARKSFFHNFARKPSFKLVRYMGIFCHMHFAS